MHVELQINGLASDADVETLVRRLTALPSVCTVDVVREGGVVTVVGDAAAAHGVRRTISETGYELASLFGPRAEHGGWLRNGRLAIAAAPS